MPLVARTIQDRTTANKRPAKRSASHHPRITPISTLSTNPTFNRKPACACGGTCPTCLGESVNQAQEAPPAPAPPVPADRDCVSPTSVRLYRSDTLEFPDHRTGGGICAVMQALPINNLCPTEITERVTLAEGATCPETLIRPSLCSGASTFTPGRNQVRTCRDVEMPDTGFVDRHSVNVRASVLHDRERNPRNLDSCRFICNQIYFISSGEQEQRIGRFEIQYQLNKDRQDDRDITRVRIRKAPAE